MVDNVDAGIGSPQTEHVAKKPSKVITFDLSASDLARVEKDRETSPRMIRTTHLDRLKTMTPYGTKHEQRRSTLGLDSFDQSIIQLLQERARGGLEGLILGEVMDKLDKVPLSKAIEERIGYRTPSVVFHANEWKGEEVMTQVNGFLDSGKAVYLKTNIGRRGEHVVRISKNGEQYVIESGDGTQLTVEDLKQYTPRKVSYRGGDLFIAEEEIPIARTSSGNTWELRLLPPLGDNYTYCKVGAEGNIVNNLAKQGEGKAYMEVLQDVVRAKYADADPARVAEIVDNFMTTASHIAAQVKDLTDDFQIQVGKAIVKPEDLKDPSKYDELMKYCFSGNFFCVDTTGVWNEQGQLVPSIVEAQAGAGLTGLADGLADSAYAECLRNMNEKLATLRAELK